MCVWSCLRCRLIPAGKPALVLAGMRQGRGRNSLHCMLRGTVSYTCQ
jgi:hypothetical protein